MGGGENSSLWLIMHIVSFAKDKVAHHSVWLTSLFGPDLGKSTDFDIKVCRIYSFAHKFELVTSLLQIRLHPQTHLHFSSTIASWCFLTTLAPHFRLIKNFFYTCSFKDNKCDKGIQIYEQKVSSL